MVSKPEAVVEKKPEPVAKAPEPVKKQPLPIEIVEVIGKPALSDAEQKKLDELRKLKAAKKAKKETPTPLGALPKIKAPSLAPLMGRKGNFEAIPDFLKMKGNFKD